MLSKNFNKNIVAHLYNLKLLTVYYPCIIDSLLFNNQSGNFFLSLNSFFLLDTYVQSEFVCFFSFLCKSSLYRFKSCTDFTAIDYLSVNNRFKMIYILSSVTYSCKINLTVYIRQETTPNSLSFIFLSVNWLEREIFDMFGIFFINHPNLQRILTDYGFSDYPLLKAYPCTGLKEVFFSPFIKRLRYYAP